MATSSTFLLTVKHSSTYRRGVTQKADATNPVSRTLDVLERLTGSDRPLSFTELCAMTGTPKATMNRTLGTLQARGYISTDRATGLYTAGIKCFELGSLWARNLDIREAAALSLEALNQKSQETVHLGIYDAGDVIYVEKLESPHQVVAKSHVGRRCPATAVATGRVLLASQDKNEIDRVLAGPLEKYTPDTLTDPEQLRDMLTAARQEGYAVNRCNYRPGVSGVAAPIRDHTGAVVAAVGICLPDYRFTPDRFPELQEWTMNAAADISLALGMPARLVRPKTAAAAL